jgi:3-isopropylmalate/(R)-2-methylmalate dehydratase small subunit
MEKFVTHIGKAIPLNRNNVDTDAIIPKQYLKSIKRTGFGPFLFDDWRYNTPGDLDIDVSTREINSEFVLNQDAYQGGSVLLARENFGCGSSREHAVWALTDYGIRAVIAPTFADIFFNNSFKNGLLPVILADEVMDELFSAAEQGEEITIDLPTQEVRAAGKAWEFEIDPFRKHCLLEGLDDIGLTLQKADKIKTYEAQRKQTAPWLFN